jgi:hypothetical protein
MELRYILATPPASEPLTTEDVRSYLRLDDDDTSQDSIISVMITAARRYAEQYTGRSLMPQTWLAVADSFPGCWIPPAPFGAYAYSYGSARSVEYHSPEEQVIKLARGPVNSITSITYVDSNGATQTLDPSTYILDTSDLVQRIAPAYGQNWPAARRQLGAVRITFAAGYANADAVPATVRNWMLIRIATAFEHREAEEIVLKGKLQALAYVDTLLDSEKVFAL